MGNQNHSNAKSKAIKIEYTKTDCDLQARYRRSFGRLLSLMMCRSRNRNQTISNLIHSTFRRRRQGKALRGLHKSDGAIDLMNHELGDIMLT